MPEEEGQNEFVKNWKQVRKQPIRQTQKVIDPNKKKYDRKKQNRDDIRTDYGQE